MKFLQVLVAALLVVASVKGHRRFKGYGSSKGNYNPYYRRQFIPNAFPNIMMQDPLLNSFYPNFYQGSPQYPISQISQNFPQQFPQIPFIPQVPSFPGMPVLREFVESGDVASAAGTSAGKGRCQVTGCPSGQQCVLEDPRMQNAFYLCTPFMKESCQCVQGCQHQRTFIPFAQSREIDTCGSKCSCYSVYGTPECDQKSCFKSPIKTTKK